MASHRFNGMVLWAAVFACMTASVARSEPAPQFWNTSTRTFTGVYLSAAGSNAWGSNQAVNDKDGSVSADERLKLVDMPSGRLDVRLVDDKGHSCVVTGVEVTTGRRYAFAIGDKELRGCPAMGGKPQG